MKRDPLRSSLPSDFDAFLFSSVIEDTTGHPLNVLSVLARLDIDPWLQAARLAGLPKKDAILELMPLIATNPAVRASDPLAEILSTRLVALLPTRAEIKDQAPDPLKSVPLMKRTDTIICLVVGTVILTMALGSEMMVVKQPVSPGTPPAVSLPDAGSTMPPLTHP